MSGFSGSLIGLFTGGAVTAAGDPYFKNTTLLLNGDGTNGQQNNTILDSSPNNLTVNRVGTPTQGSFSPFSQTGWSVNTGVFNSTNSFLTAPGISPAFNLDANFTIEAWINITSGTGRRGIIGLGSSASADWILGVTGANNNLYFSTQVANSNSTTAIPYNTWTHVAAVYDFNIGLKLYVNGVQVLFDFNAPDPVSQMLLYIGADSAIFEGYISNLRVVKDVAVYSGAFTPPTSPLTKTQSAGTNIRAITGSQTSLLTFQDNRFKDNSNYAFPVSVANGTPSIQAFSPFNPNIPYSAAAVGGNGYFGASDYLTFPRISPGGDFTMECWFYQTAKSGNYCLLFSDTSAQYSFAIALDYNLGGGILNGSVGLYDTALGSMSSSAAVFSMNCWNHIALTKSGSVHRMFLNGVQVATKTGPSNFPIDTLGTWTGGNLVYKFYGYISSARVVNGTAVYTSNFTPPAAPVTAITNTALLTNFTNLGIFDSTAKNNATTFGGAQVSNSPSKYGTGSMYFNGSGYNLLFQPTPLHDLTGDFTIEFWFYPGSITGMPLNKGGGAGIANASYELNCDGTYINFAASSNNASYDIGSETGPTGRIGAPGVFVWSHIAVTRSGNVYRGFLNGVQGYTQTLALTPYTTSTRGLSIGGNYTGTWGTGTSTSNISGYIDDLRITKGIARYTANFTPPAQALPVQ